MKSLLAAILTAGKNPSSWAAQAEVREIVLGQSAPLSGSFSELGAAYRDGTLLYFDHVNRAGGVNGNRIRVITLDDGYSPQRAKDNAHQLIERDKVFALFGFMFTNTVKASLPIATAARVPYIAPYAGYDELFSQFNPMLFLTRSNFSSESDVLLKHIRAMGIPRIALVRYDSPAGIALEKEISSKASGLNIALTSVGMMKLNSKDPAQAVAKLVDQRPVAVILGVSGADAVAFVRQFNKSAKALPIQYFARSLIGGHQLISELAGESRGIVMSQLSPSPFTGKTRIAQEYQTVMKEARQRGAGLNANYLSFEGFIAAKVFVEGLRRAGANPTRSSLIAGLESLHQWDCGDFFIDFSPDNHNGSRFVDVTVIGAGGHIID